MKKTKLLSIMFIVFCLLITGCSNGNSSTEEPKVEETSEVINEQEKTDESENIINENGLKNPTMEWWELFNPNGFNTVAALITNTNDISIDVSYDLVYYKDGKEVARNEMCSNYAILPGHQDIIWSNYEIPSKEEVDDIKMENVFVSESSYTPIDGEFELDGIGTEGELYFLPLLDKEPTFLSAWFVFYIDNNSNDKIDKDEVYYVANSGYDLVDDRWIMVEPLDFNYTDVDVYFTAY